MKALTRALLKNDFDLDVELPSDSLVPRIPLRLNYILWLEDMVEQMEDDQKVKREISGIDIGKLNFFCEGICEIFTFRLGE